jgi:nucleoside-diphosphate-sugar epimerase
MRLLVIGGTSFIGLHAVREATAAGHEVTLFNRGLTDAEAFPTVERLRGDRERREDLEVLRGRDWDAVLDTCGFDYRVVERSSEILRGHVGHYTFISSIAVYADLSAMNQEDDAKLTLPEDMQPGERAYGGSTLYGPMKVRCEEVIAETFPDRWLVVRPTSVSGPLDHGASNRRTGYWGARVRDYAEFLVPRPRQRVVSYIDVRDMAAWIVAGAARGLTGAFNLAAPALTMEQFLETARELYGSSARAIWADPQWLLEEGVKPNVELPWWVPHEPNMFAVDSSKALANGLTIRPIEETIRDSAEWEDIRPPGLALQSPFAGQARGALLDRERELELIELWRSRVSTRTGVGR